MQNRQLTPDHPVLACAADCQLGADTARILAELAKADAGLPTPEGAGKGIAIRR